MARAFRTTPSTELSVDTMRSIDLFQQWPQQALRELLPRTSIISTVADQALLEQGQVLNGLYAVLSGGLELTSLRRNGQRYIRRYAEPGRILGFLGVFDGKGSTYYYITREPSEILFVPKPALLCVLSRHPDLWLSVVKEVAGYQRTMYEVIEQELFETLRVRLVRALISFSEAHGCYDTEAKAVQVRLTQDNFGSLLGTSRQSVSKELKRLEREGLVRIEYGKLWLLDLSALEQVIDVD